MDVYASKDETYGDWAERRLEREAERGVLTNLRGAIPQTAPVTGPGLMPSSPAGGMTLSGILRQIADALDQQAAAGVAAQFALDTIEDLP